FNASGGTLDVTGNLLLPGTNQLAGAGALTKTGAGTLAISGANNFAGPVTLQQGGLQLQNAGALGSGSSKSRITLAPSTTLDLRSDGPYPANFGNDVVVQDNTAATAAAITTGPIVNAPATAGVFQLGALRMGNATLATG